MQSTQDIYRALSVEVERGYCQGCGLPISERAYRVPKVVGTFCSIACIETVLFGAEHCRWCGDKIGKPYNGADSRLCCPDCSKNHYAHVFGDYAATLGKGMRLKLWLERKYPATYRQIIGGAGTPEGFCQNPKCPNGENGLTASLTHLRAGSLFCSDACRVQANRSPNRQKSASKTPVFIEVSRNTFTGKAPRPTQDAWSRPGRFARSGTEGVRRWTEAARISTTT